MSLCSFSIRPSLIIEHRVIISCFIAMICSNNWTLWQRKLVIMLSATGSQRALNRAHGNCLWKAICHITVAMVWTSFCVHRLPHIDTILAFYFTRTLLLTIYFHLFSDIHKCSINMPTLWPWPLNMYITENVLLNEALVFHEHRLIVLFLMDV